MIVVCLTFVLVAGLVAFVIRDLIMDARSTRIFIARQQRVDEGATAGLAAAIVSLREVADRMAPAPVRVGRPTTIRTRDDQTIHGILIEEFEDRTRLVDAFLIDAAGKHPIPGGTASVFKVNESWRQEHDR